MSDVEPRIMMEVLLGYLLFILAVILALVFNRVWVMYFATMLVTIMFLRNMKVSLLLFVS